MPRRCSECRKTISPAPSASATQRVCSAACRAVRDRKLARARRRHGNRCMSPISRCAARSGKVAACKRSRQRYTTSPVLNVNHFCRSYCRRFTMARSRNAELKSLRCSTRSSRPPSSHASTRRSTCAPLPKQRSATAERCCRTRCANCRPECSRSTWSVAPRSEHTTLSDSHTIAPYGTAVNTGRTGDLRLKISVPQLYRLLDPTNKRKSISQLMSRLHVLDCDVQLIVRRRTAA
jgi:hypothetical protein